LTSTELHYSPDRFPWLKGARCAVTGGAGFIGGHLSEALASLGAEVTVIDDLSSGSANLAAKLPARFVKGTITDSACLAEVFKDVSCVFHLAAMPSVPRSLKQPMETAWVNMWGTQQVLESARQAGVKRIVYSASSSAYGGIEGTAPRTEDLAPRPLSPYASQKLNSEYLVRAYSLSGWVDGVSLRYFNIFGPRQNPDSPYAAVIPKFICEALAGNQITVHGDGRQSRDFTHVHNAVLANLLASCPDVAGRGEVFNVGCGANYSLLDLLAEIQTSTGKTLKIKHVDARVGDVRFSRASIEKLQSVFRYRPEIDFHAGLHLLIQHYQK
jgi:UDP-glucose 4-epimerase